jgi:hypothetical protein
MSTEPGTGMKRRGKPGPNCPPAGFQSVHRSLLLISDGMTRESARSAKLP